MKNRKCKKRPENLCFGGVKKVDFAKHGFFLETENTNCFKNFEEK